MCDILTDGFRAGFWKHMQYFKQFRAFISQRLSQETLNSGDAVLHPDYASSSLQADTHVSIVDVEHVNLCWRFNFLNTSSVPTERQRRKCQFHSLIREETRLVVHPQALDKWCRTPEQEKFGFAIKWHFGTPNCLFYMEMTERGHNGHRYWGISDLQFQPTGNIKFCKEQNTCLLPLTVEYRQILYGGLRREFILYS